MAKSETLGYTSVLGPKYSDLRRRLVFLLLGLVVYRIGAHIPVPGIDPGQLAQILQRQQGWHCRPV
jgi:preprotein translocase subunit SecY